MRKKFFLSIFSGICVFALSFFVTDGNIVKAAYPSSVGPFNQYRLYGGVGLSGNYTREYYVENASTSQLSGSESAMNKWNNNNPISFRRTTDRSASEIDILFYYYGNTQWYGQTLFYADGRQVQNSDGTPNRSWVWSEIRMNDYYHGDMLRYETNTERVVSHEIGHAFGMRHTSNTSSIMFDSWPQVLSPSYADYTMVKSMYP